jgi:hypothetical protein
MAVQGSKDGATLPITPMLNPSPMHGTWLNNLENSPDMNHGAMEAAPGGVCILCMKAFLVWRNNSKRNR